MEKLLKKRIPILMASIMLFTVLMGSGVIKQEQIKADNLPNQIEQPTTKDDYSKYSIWLNTGYAYMHVGQTKQVKVNKSGFTGGKVWFESDDTDIATVDSSGRIKARHSGETTITAYCSYNGYVYEDYIDIEVSKPYLSNKNVGLYIKENYKIRVYDNGQKPKWKSSNKKVAIVKNGKIYAKKKGKATITCTVDGLKLKCKVKVYNPTLSYSKRYITQGFNYKLKIYGKSKKGKWWTANSSIAKVNNKGKVSGVNPGTTTIYCKTDGIVTKCKVVIEKNEAKFKPHYKSLMSVPYGTVKLDVRRAYFSGNKLKVEVEIFNKTSISVNNIAYIRQDLYVDGKLTVAKEFYNTPIHIGSFSKKKITLTLCNSSYYKKHIDMNESEIYANWSWDVN